MITDDGDPLFPINVVQLLAARFNMLDPDVKVFSRRLYTTDPVQCIGVSASTWAPDEQSFQMRGQLSSEPSIGAYIINVQSMIKDTDEQRGIVVHSKLAKIVRGLILSDPLLLESLQGLSSTLYGVAERYLRMKVPIQRYLAQELSGQFVFLSTVEVRIETENTYG